MYINPLTIRRIELPNVLFKTQIYKSIKNLIASLTDTETSKHLMLRSFFFSGILET